MPMYSVSQEEQPEQLRGPSNHPKTTRKRMASASSRTTRLTINLPIDLVNRLRNTVYWIPYLTLAGLAADAIESALHQLETDNRGPFPRRVQELKPGRPRSRQVPSRSQSSPSHHSHAGHERCAPPQPMPSLREVVQRTDPRHGAEVQMA